MVYKIYKSLLPRANENVTYIYNMNKHKQLENKLYKRYRGGLQGEFWFCWIGIFFSIIDDNKLQWMVMSNVLVLKRRTDL